MDPKTGELARPDVTPPTGTFSGPHTPTNDQVKKDPRFLAREEMAKRVQEGRSVEEKAFTPDVLNDDGTITPAADAAPEQAGTATPVADVKEPENKQPDTPKTFTQVELDEIVSKMLAKEQRKFERDSARRIAEAVAHVAALGLFRWVEVDVDDVVEHAHSNRHHARH